MKRFSQSQQVRWTSSRCRVTLALWVVGAIFVSTLGSRTDGAAGTIDSCRRTADAVLNSCQDGAQSDYQLALGKCENIASSGLRKACQQQAADDLKEALQTCSDQH